MARLGAIDIFMSDQPRQGCPGELGLVYEQFYLATAYDPEDRIVLGDMSSGERGSKQDCRRLPFDEPTHADLRR